MRCPESIADEHVMAMRPLSVAYIREPAPDGPVRHKLLTAEVLFKYALAHGPRLILRHVTKVSPRECLRVDLDYERAHVRREPVMMRIEMSQFVLAKCLSQGFKSPARPEPGKAVGKKCRSGTKSRFEGAADEGVRCVSGKNQLRPTQFVVSTN